MPLEEAKTFQRVLATKGVRAELDHNGHTCTRGCTVTVEVLIPDVSLPIVQDTLREQYEKLTEGLPVDWSRVNEVYDQARDRATCPACGTSFSTSLTECPECGLCF